LLDLVLLPQAPSGHRRHSSTDTPRQRIEAKSLPAIDNRGKYWPHHDDAEPLVTTTSSLEFVQAWAKRIAAEAPPMTDHGAATLVSILRGALS